MSNIASNLLYFIYLIIFLVRNLLFFLVLVFIIYSFFSKYVLKKKIEGMESFILFVGTERNYFLNVYFELLKSHIFWPKWYHNYYYNIRGFLQLLFFCMLFSLLIENFFGLKLLREIYPMYIIASYLIADNLLFIFMDRFYILPNLNEFYKSNGFFSIDGVENNSNPKKSIINKYFNFQNKNIANGFRRTGVAVSICSSCMFMFWIYNDWYAIRYPNEQTPVNRIWDSITNETTPIKSVEDPNVQILKLKEENLLLREEYFILNFIFFVCLLNIIF